ncbi:hypothetical protein DSO57_1029396 [Entomophthora muscae]|uniref:Uncharacterized protein n=1 Tax=Entomophthora muscae TaxID=34485 RepID=A0ACC2SDT3_9FUNG|nr:hypothetical protein DSO57_1029396 [Entomophthora muscae]
MEPTSFDELPLLVLERIVILSCNPRIAHVNRTIYRIWESSYVRFRWFLNFYNTHPLITLRRSIGWDFFDPKILVMFEKHLAQHLPKGTIGNLTCAKSQVVYPSAASVGLDDSKRKRHKTSKPPSKSLFVVATSPEAPFKVDYSGVPIPKHIFTREVLNPGKLELLKCFLERKLSLLSFGSFGLLKSIRGNNIPVIELLLHNGVDPNTLNFLPMRSACDLGNLKVVQLLLDAGADLDSKALSMAYKKGHMAVVRFLLSKGAAPDLEMVNSLF